MTPATSISARNGVPVGKKNDDGTTTLLEGQPLFTAAAGTPASGSVPVEDQAPLLHNTVVVLPGLLTEGECEAIVLETERILRENRASRGVKTEKWATFSRFDPECRRILDRLLREHVLAFIELRLPDVARRLFRRGGADDAGSEVSDDDGGRRCGRDDGGKPVPTGMPMDYYWDDPVVIKYTAGNRLAPHEDMRELTIVVPLNPLGGFPLEGGGTRFWPEGTAPEDAGSDAGVSVHPAPGSGIIFNGNITHSGNSVYGGTRFIMMTSINLDE